MIVHGARPIQRDGGLQSRIGEDGWLSDDGVLRAGEVLSAGAEPPLAARTDYSRYYDGVSCIVGGFPCQDISRAGKRAGITGSRSGLWRNMVEAIRLVRPRYVIVENVADLIDGDLGVVLGDLAEIGYDAESHCIPARAVGANHERDRIWIIAYPKRNGIQGRTLEASQGPVLCRAEQLSGFLFASIGDALSAARVWRADNGPSSRLDVARNKAIGNAVVPQIPELIGRAILQAEGIAA